MTYFPGIGMRLDEKVAMAIETFRTFLPADGQPYWGAFSGGKDSCVIKELGRLSGVPIDWHYSVTTVDPPELVYFIRQHHKDVKFDLAPKPMWKMAIYKNNLPTGRRRWCCDIYKESKSPRDRVVIVGVRACESKKRADRWRTYMTVKGRSPVVAPILYWTDDDVWGFIRERSLPYCKLYDEGFKRLGCVMCPLARGKMKTDAERWPMIAKKWRETVDVLFEKFTKDCRLASRLNANWHTPQDMWEWWTGIQDGESEPEECQGLSLFSDDEVDE